MTSALILFVKFWGWVKGHWEWLAAGVLIVVPVAFLVWALSQSFDKGAASMAPVVSEAKGEALSAQGSASNAKVALDASSHRAQRDRSNQEEVLSAQQAVAYVQGDPDAMWRVYLARLGCLRDDLGACPNAEADTGVPR